MGRWRRAAQKAALSCCDGREKVSGPAGPVCVLRAMFGRQGEPLRLARRTLPHMVPVPTRLS